MEVPAPDQVRIAAILARSQQMAETEAQRVLDVPLLEGDDLELLCALIEGTMTIDRIGDSTLSKWDVAIGMDVIARLITHFQTKTVPAVSPSNAVELALVPDKRTRTALTTGLIQNQLQKKSQLPQTLIGALGGVLGLEAVAEWLASVASVTPVLASLDPNVHQEDPEHAISHDSNTLDEDHGSTMDDPDANAVSTADHAVPHAEPIDDSITDHADDNLFHDGDAIH